MSCTKAQGFLEANAIEAREVTDASKQKQGRDQALALAKSADKIVVARGKKVVTLDMKRDKPDDATLLAHILGPTGNLRAPTIRKGTTLLVGFGEEAYEQLLGN